MKAEQTNGRSSGPWPSTLNLILAHFAVTPIASGKDLEWLFANTPAHIVVVTYDAAVAAEEQFQETTAILERMTDRWHTHFMTNGVIMGKKCRIASLTCKETYVLGGNGFVCVEAAVAAFYGNPGPAVAVGAVYEVQKRGGYGGFCATFISKVQTAIKKHNVRFVAGLFSCPPEDVQDLFSTLHTNGTSPFFQPFWTEDANPLTPCWYGNEVDVHAVADRYKVRPKDVKYIAVYPAYIVILGPCREVVVPAVAAQPWWNRAWAPSGSIIDKRVKCVSSVPIWPQGAADRSCGLIDFAKVKQKVPNMKWWANGVHQIILWVGSSRPSKQSKANKWQWRR